VAHESVQVGGFGAEVAATVAEHAQGVKVRRLGSPRALIAYAPNLENQLRVTPDMITAANAVIACTGETEASSGPLR